MPFLILLSIIVFWIILYFVIKVAVKNAIIEAREESTNKEGYTIAKTTCPDCGEEHDIDFAKCPNCKKRLI
ncbi:MAG: DUF6019 family protein [Defluviitaleaceae bacterium]|nr:DUF6019 family protein [Defluviitaleaceae bacterium]